MPTLAEVYALHSGNDAFVQRCEAALAEKCDDILYANTPANQVTWAIASLRDIHGAAQTMLWAIVGHSSIYGVWVNGDASRVPTDDEVKAVVAFLVPFFAA